MYNERRPNPCKQYVKVRADFDFDGRIIPLKFRTEDGDAVTIDQILDVRASHTGNVLSRFPHLHRRKIIMVVFPKDNKERNAMSTPLQPTESNY